MTLYDTDHTRVRRQFLVQIASCNSNPNWIALSLWVAIIIAARMDCGLQPQTPSPAHLHKQILTLPLPPSVCLHERLMQVQQRPRYDASSKPLSRRCRDARFSTTSSFLYERQPLTWSRSTVTLHWRRLSARSTANVHVTTRFNFNKSGRVAGQAQGTIPVSGLLLPSGAFDTRRHTFSCQSYSLFL